MSQLSDLRLHVHTTYSVKPDGTEGEVLEQTTRYGNEKKGLAYSSVEEALAGVDGTEIEEGEIVDKVVEAPEKE
jgi:hypothetical protein